LAESGNYVRGEPLAVTGRYVSQHEVLSDGPFIEAKEGVSGYDIILAENLGSGNRYCDDLSHGDGRMGYSRGKTRHGSPRLNRPDGSYSN
jgi:hypothetical protein